MNKTILLAGTNQKSIGRYLGKYLRAQGWDIWLYSRHAKCVEKAGWHERACDITREREVISLLKEMPSPDVIVFLADADGHGELPDLSEEKIRQTIDAKLVGSVILAKNLISSSSSKSKMKMVWCAGNVSDKPKDIILYGVVNSGLYSFVKELNRHYADKVGAFYLSTGVVSGTTLGDEYLRKKPQYKKIAETPQAIIERVKKIIEGKTEPGLIIPKDQRSI